MKSSITSSMKKPLRLPDGSQAAMKNALRAYEEAALPPLRGIIARLGGQ